MDQSYYGKGCLEVLTLFKEFKKLFFCWSLVKITELQTRTPSDVCFPPSFNSSEEEERFFSSSARLLVASQLCFGHATR